MGNVLFEWKNRKDTFRKSIVMKISRILRIVFIVLLLLLIPFFAMQLTDEVEWKFGDFIVAGFLLMGTGWGIELVREKVKDKNYRTIIILLILILLLLIWAELAVGIFENFLSMITLQK